MSEARLEMALKSDPGHLPDARERLRAWALSRGWEEQQIAEIVLALDEALTNVIRHGYGGARDHTIQVCAEVVQDPQHGEGLEIRVRDFGKQVDPADICGRDLDDVRPGGLGVHIIRSMTNSVEYHRAEGGGMLLVMTKFKTHRACSGNPRD
jgi:anti-sigma regulatory factor (Ser/Thr protein kinase)